MTSPLRPSGCGPPQEWRPIATAPRDGTAVLVFHTAWDVPRVGICHGETDVWQQASGDLLRTPLCWTGLPPLPREADWLADTLRAG